MNDNGAQLSFLDLAPELRNTILTLIARDHGKALLQRNSRGIVSSIDPISFANKQTREEYLGLLYQHAATTVAANEVKALPTKAATRKPLDESRLLQKRGAPTPYNPFTFVTWPPTSKPAINTSLELEKPRTTKIVLDFTPSCKHEDTYPLRWLNRLKVQHKIGANAEILCGVMSAQPAYRWEGHDLFAYGRQRSWCLTEVQVSELGKMQKAVKAAVNPKY